MSKALTVGSESPHQGMRRFDLLALGVIVLLGSGCRSTLRVTASDAGRDGTSLDCGPRPKSSCGYYCASGQWVRAPLLCLPDADVFGFGGEDAAAAADLSVGDAMPVVDSSLRDDAGSAAQSDVASGARSDVATGVDAPACVQAFGNTIGPAIGCPCLSTSTCPADGPEQRSCDHAEQECFFDGNACQIVSCTCLPGDGGLEWSCRFLLMR
jgi:hypothetical protein